MDTTASGPGRSSSTSPSASLCVVAALALAVMLAGLGGHTLVDPWETHYAEVARELIDRGDPVRLWWQDQPFRSKPVLTPWLIAASLEVHGIGAGKFSGALVAGDQVMWAVRLPFALFGALGLVMTWWMVARLASRRVAWWSALALATMPLYFFVARQAITDIPMVATTIAAIACFAVAIAAPERPLVARWGPLHEGHAALAALAAATVPQLVAIGLRFASHPLGPGVRAPVPWLVATAPFAVGLALVIASAAWRWRLRTTDQAAALWGYLFVAVGVLGKGPPGAALVGVVALALLAATGRWRWLRRARLAEGIAILAVVAGPWHLAMVLADGPAWAVEYFGQHWLARASEGMHGDRGGFGYYARQIAIGTFPWIALVPAAVVAAVRRGRPRSPRDALAFSAAVWAIAGFAVFGVVETKFHHYVAPVVPALAILAALWLDDRPARPPWIALGLGAALALVVGRSLARGPDQLIELFVYRHDRPWPETIDFSTELSAFAVAAAASGVLAAWSRARRAAVVALAAVAIAFAAWSMHRYLPAAAAHWGQRPLHATYYARRRLLSLDLAYATPADLGRAVATPLVAVRVAPGPLHIGDHLPVALHATGGEVTRSTARVVWRGHTVLWLDLALDDGSRRALARGAHGQPTGRPPRLTIDVERLIAWQLLWRGENFWSGGEIWAGTREAQTAFPQTDSRAFRAYLAEVARPGRRYFVITEAGRAGSLRAVLPTEPARASVRVEHDSGKHFTLLSFVL